MKQTREAVREIDRYEAEFGADGTRVFRETEDLAEDDSGIESLTDEELDALPISTVKDGEVVTYPNAEALLDDQKESLTPPPQVKRSSGVAPHVLHPEINTEYRTNFQIESDDIGVGTPLERFYHNIRAIQLLTSWTRKAGWQHLRSSACLPTMWAGAVSPSSSRRIIPIIPN